MQEQRKIQTYCLEKLTENESHLISEIKVH